MAGRLLTREEYDEAITRHFDTAKMEFLEWVKFLDRESFRELALRRFDEAASKYAGDPDLTSRDWWYESDEEGIDGVAYQLFEIVKEERDLP